MNIASDITVLQLPKFKTEATELIGAGGIEAVAVYLIDHLNAGSVIPGAAGVRKLRWAAKGKGERGGARIVYLYVMIAARIAARAPRPRQRSEDLRLRRPNARRYPFLDRRRTLPYGPYTAQELL